MGRSWKSFNVHARKRQDCHQGTFNGDTGELSERKEERCRVNFHPLWEPLNKPIQNIGRKTEVKGNLDNVSEWNEEQVTELWRKASPRYKMAKNLPAFMFMFECLIEGRICEW